MKGYLSATVVMIACFVFFGQASASDTCNSRTACETTVKCNNDDMCLSILKSIIDSKIGSGKMVRMEAYGHGGIYPETQKACREQMKLSPTCKPVVMTKICEANGGRDCAPPKTQTAAKAGPQAGAKAPVKSFNNPSLQKYLKNVPQNLRQ